MIQDITILNVYDFDETFVRVPSYSAKKSAETSELNFSHPYDYYDHAASLCEDTYHIQLIKPVFDFWKESSQNPECYQALITHRVEEVRDEVMSILESRGVTFHEHFFLGRKTSKADSLITMIEKFPKLTEVRIFEDSIQQLEVYERLYNQLRLKSNRIYPSFRMFIVDKSKMYEIENIKLSNPQKIELI